MRARALLLGLFGLFATAMAADPVSPARLSPAQLREDLQFIQRVVTQIHPDIGFSANTDALKAAMAHVDAQLVGPMTPDETWRLFATLNSVFADAHVSVISPDPSGQTAALHASGQGLFPFEVSVDAAGQVHVLSELGGAASPHAGARIEHINGVRTADVSAALLARTNGDTPAFRAVNLSGRWWWWYWKTFGTPRSFELELTLAGRRSVVSLPASPKQPVWLADSDGAAFDRAFHVRDLDDSTALLTVNTFSLADKPRFHAFTEQVFTRLRDDKIRTLVIDIRQNGGGDDDLWKDGLLRYIATKPYRHGSSYLLRVIEGRQRDGQKVGDLVNGQIEGWVQPRLDEPLLFKGKVYVVIGGATYSSAVLFSNVVQDFGFGTVVGVGGHARARQSGGTQLYTLPHSQLKIVAPRFILDRPSGLREPAWLTPDLPLADNPFDREQLIRALLITRRPP